MLHLFDSLPTHMDFMGQKKAEKLFQTLILAFAVVGLAVGYHFEQFSYTVYSLGAGFAISCLLTLPPWPMYRKNPLKWQKCRKEIKPAGDDVSASSSPSAKGKKKK